MRTYFSGSMKDILNKLKLGRIQTLGVDCGLGKAGTKKQLIADVCEARRGVRWPRRILSIDMGVRNLAFCKLNLGGGQPTVERWSVMELDGLRFEQPHFGRMAVDLLKGVGLDAVDTILIERQRMRSNGLRNVPEWIVRVNLLEAMVHALLQSHLDRAEYDYTVVSVLPSRVMNYWIRPSTPTVAANPNARYRLTKTAKVDLVSAWLGQDEKPFTLDPDAARTIASLKKKDDLADALLQALAWTQWTNNLHLLQHSPDSPEEFDHLINQMETQYSDALPSIYRNL